VSKKGRKGSTLDYHGMGELKQRIRGSKGKREKRKEKRERNRKQKEIAYKRKLCMNNKHIYEPQVLDIRMK